MKKIIFVINFVSEISIITSLSLHHIDFVKRLPFQVSYFISASDIVALYVAEFASLCDMDLPHANQQLKLDDAYTPTKGYFNNTDYHLEFLHLPSFKGLWKPFLQVSLM